jgi:endo-1,4-beta-xylanase
MRLSIFLSLLFLSSSLIAAPTPLATAIEMKSVAEWKVVSKKQDATFTPNADASRLLVRVPKPCEKAWDVMLHSPALAAELKKGQQLWFSFELADVGTEELSPPFAIYLHPTGSSKVVHQVRMTTFKGGTRIQETWTADKDYPAGGLNFSLHFAQGVGSMEVGPLTTRIYDASVKPAELPGTPLNYEGRSADAPWRKVAQQSIEQHRMSPVTVQITSTTGQPVPEATISWHQDSHAFGFGSFAEPTLLKDDKDGENYRKYFKELFNYATVGAYLAEWGWLKDKGRSQSLQIADWLKREGIPARGHLLVYPGYTACPVSWKEISDSERRSRVEAHIPAVLGALGERGITEYDVVNELRDNMSFCDDLGKPTKQTGLEVVTEWFKTAKKLAPKSELYINEYWILAGSGQTQKEQDLYLGTIEKLTAAGAPVDGIGIQGHFGSGLTAPSKLLNILDRFAKLGKRIRITEFDQDIADEEAQAEYTRDFYTTLYSHPAVDGIVQWGFWEGIQWKPRAAMFRKDWTPKPNYFALKKLLKETLASHFEGKANADGLWQEKAHRGLHTLTVKTPSYTVSQQVRVGNEPARFVVTVP